MGVQLCNPPLTGSNHYPQPQVLTRGPNLALTLDFGLSLGHMSTLGVGGYGYLQLKEVSKIALSEWG